MSFDSFHSWIREEKALHALRLFLPFWQAIGGGPFVAIERLRFLSLTLCATFSRLICARSSSSHLAREKGLARTCVLARSPQQFFGTKSDMKAGTKERRRDTKHFFALYKSRLPTSPFFLFRGDRKGEKSSGRRRGKNPSPSLSFPFRFGTNARPPLPAALSAKGPLLFRTGAVGGGGRGRGREEKVCLPPRPLSLAALFQLLYLHEATAEGGGRLK